MMTDMYGLEETLLQRAEGAKCIHFNPDAALQKRICEHGFAPNSPEFSLQYQGETYIAQRTERLSDGAVRVYYCLEGDWGNVHFISPPSQQAPAPQFHFEQWPTEYCKITQKFGARPEYYRKYRFPGHEGIDIRAPANSKVFCVAPGCVKMVQTDEKKSRYGIHLCVTHAGGYETIYAHLNMIAVKKGQAVEAGEMLGLAGSTGNSDAPHLHFTLKHRGETYEGYRDNIIDPTPFLAPLLNGVAEDHV